MVQAADAARAASDAVVALRDQQSNRGSTGGGFQEASRVVRQPEPEQFGSESHEDDLSKWQDFNVSFKAWPFTATSTSKLTFISMTARIRGCLTGLSTVPSSRAWVARGATLGIAASPEPEALEQVQLA